MSQTGKQEEQRHSSVTVLGMLTGHRRGQGPGAVFGGWGNSGRLDQKGNQSQFIVKDQSLQIFSCIIVFNNNNKKLS